MSDLEARLQEAVRQTQALLEEARAAAAGGGGGGRGASQGPRERRGGEARSGWGGGGAQRPPARAQPGPPAAAVRSRSPAGGRQSQPWVRPGGGGGREEGPSRRHGGPPERGDMDLNHGRLFRLLKLVQRNPGTVPPKELFARWNDFCDARAPQDSGRPVRDPKHLGRDLILAFLQELPRNFWVFLTKKIQAQGRERGLNDTWTEFCDAHAPRLPQNETKAIRDPRNLEPRFLITFIAFVLEKDEDGGVAAIIDDFQFDFTLEERPARAPAAEAPRRGAAGGGGGHVIGRDPPLAAGRGGPAPARGAEAGKASSKGRRSRSPRRSAAGGAWPPGVPVQHGSLHRLLKLVQRNTSSTPPKEVFNRWNDFCERTSPLPSESDLGFQPQNPRPIRDPKLLPKENIRRFLGHELPRGFWVSLVKKIQGEKSQEFGKVWEAFCDHNAPRLSQGKGSAAVRDPRMLEPEFLLAFVVNTLEKDDSDGRLAQIIDSFQFIFKDGPSAEQANQPIRKFSGEDASGRGQAGGKGKGKGKGKARQAPGARPPAGDHAADGSEEVSAEALARLVRLLQRSSDTVKRRWDSHCDEHAPRRGGAGLRDPRLHSQDFLRSFLTAEVPVDCWAEAVQRSLVDVPPVAEMWDEFNSAREDEGADPWGDPDPLLDFLCRALGRHESVADSIGSAAEKIDEAGDAGEAGEFDEDARAQEDEERLPYRFVNSEGENGSAEGLPEQGGGEPAARGDPPRPEGGAMRGL